MPASLTIAERSAEFSRYIRLLAMAGKKYFKQYLYDPLYAAGWERPGPPAYKQIERAKSLIPDPSFSAALPLHCKKAVGQAMIEGYAPLGDTALFFLEVARCVPKAAIQKETAEFMRVIEAPLLAYKEIQDNRSESVFAEAVAHLSPAEFQKAFEPVELDAAAPRSAISQQVAILYQQVLAASRRGDLQRCARLLAKYTIDFGDSDDYNAAELAKLTAALTQREPKFAKTLNDLIAVELYYMISRGIMQGNVKSAIRGIRKYAHVFDGDPRTNYFYEIDRLERSLYRIIGERDLWKELKREA